MYYNGQQIFPDQLVAGDNLVLAEFTLGEYPSSDYDLKIAAGITGEQITATADKPAGTDNFEWDIPSATTALWTAGDYTITGYVVEIATAERTTLVPSSRFVVDVDIASQVGGYDGRTWAEISYDNATAVLQSKATKDQMSYSIAGRSLAHYSYSELMDLIKWLDRIIKAERRAELVEQGKTQSNIAKIYFGSA